MSIARAYEHMLAVPRYVENVRAFEESMKPWNTGGLGVWHGIRLKDKANLIACLQRAKELGALFGSGFDNTLMICPKPDASPEHFARVREILMDICG